MAYAKQSRINTLFVTYLLMLIFLLCGCTSIGGGLKSNSLSIDDFMKRSNDKEMFNIIRFETIGGAPQVLYGYFLYRDSVEVDKVLCKFENTEKMHLNEIFLDYDRMTKRVLDITAVKPDQPVIREFYRNNTIVGYSLGDIALSITAWDVTPPNSGSKIILDLSCSDQRSTSGAPMGLYSR